VTRFCVFVFLLSLRAEVTLKDVAAYRTPTAWKPVWAPEGGRFVYEESEKLHLYDADTRQSRVLVSLEELKGKAKSRPESGPFGWRNRRVADRRCWCPREAICSGWMLRPANRPS
jgi:hypothetical protein